MTGDPVVPMDGEQMVFGVRCSSSIQGSMIMPDVRCMKRGYVQGSYMST